ncbi:hypothetical protein SBDP1_1720006 [Syntrophobacter sp. SbD1]|nr:hypothetical protein SBDP1_1720006 [Syntrophobacter sp. SbD1]
MLVFKHKTASAISSGDRDETKRNCGRLLNWKEGAGISESGYPGRPKKLGRPDSYIVSSSL